MPTRREMWERLDGTFDVLVVGGGINGAGIARDAAHRGLEVAVCEMGDLASGTSSRSSKLVHGGLRYLEYLEFSLVFESVSERRILLDIAPHLVNPLGFLFPVYKGSRRGLLTVNAGMWLYEGLSLFRSPKRHRTVHADEIEEVEPALLSDGLKGAPLFYDCSTDDARLTLETALDAARKGAIVAPYAKVNAFVHDEAGRITGVEVECQRTGETKTVKAHAVINATGPWTDDTISLSKPLDRDLLRPTKGIHIVVEHDKLPINNAVTCFHPTDKRVLFAIPWGDRTYLGTTDTDYEGDPADVHADLADVDYLLEVAQYYFPDHEITRDDVIATWAGLRPLIAPAGDEDEDEVQESAVSREHQIIVGHDGLITIAGGKLTTYRRMSNEVVDTAVKLLRLSDNLPDNIMASHTDHEPLPGAVGWPEDDDHDRVARRVYEVANGAFDETTARHLADTYGMRGIDIAREVRRDTSLAEPIIDGRVEIMGQVDWAVRREIATCLSDVMIRRTQLFYRALDQGLEAAERVATHMAELLDWDDARKQREIDEYAEDVALSRAWREEI